MFDRDVDGGVALHSMSSAFWRALGIAMLFALASPAASGVRTPEKWPVRRIQVILCTADISAPAHRSRCHQSSSLTAAQADLTRRAISEWNRVFAGHIVFDYTTDYQTDVVRIFSTTKKECFVNRTGWRATGTAAAVFIANDCNQWTVAHELAHIVGVHHEQRRPDRDLYVTVPADSLRQAATSGNGAARRDALQFARLCDVDLIGPCTMDFVPVSNPGLFAPEYGVSVGDYDFASVMHYSLFSDLGGANYLMSVRRPGGTDRLDAQHLAPSGVGQRMRFSAGDIETVKSMYPFEPGVTGP